VAFVYIRGNMLKFKENKQFYLHVLAIAVPFMLQQLITSSVNLLDNLMVGQLGDAAIAGVAAANRFYMIANFGIFGVGGAMSIFLAQYFGAKDEEHVKQSFRYGILSAYVIVTPFIILGFLFPNQILGFFTRDLEVIKMGSDYLKLAILTYIPMALSMTIGNAMRSLGETKVPMYSSIVAIFTNAFFNYVLIFGHFGFPALGVAGAAYGTIIARLVEVVIFLLVSKRMNFMFKTAVKDLFKISRKLAKAMTIKAVPLAVNEIFWSGGMSILFMFYSTRGKEVMAGMSISGSVADLFFTLFGGMAVATTVVVSQVLGANKLDEARKNAYLMIRFSVMLAVVLGILMFGSSFIAPNFYNVTDYSRETATTFLRIMSFMFWIYMTNAQCFFILRAGGDTKSTLLMDSVFMWVVNLPAVGLVTYLTGWNVYAIYLVGQSTDFLKLIVAYGLVRKEKWVKNLAHTHEENLVLLDD
jgi:putative MATE family efflux protein